ncbi:phytoene desaturase family protein [Microbacterium sp. ASV49]|uniref:NAD(P)/FAD-dependent oxidoreductase n=1 Tax=Microbacterium candidum TaxID=3041922 RepID=A0ABT7MWV2_9MICO|nr:NAD(P)/FAD-dependent oxidoreductase [Microbacterium sp. ASV49]MDL9978916.1 NAD(P)/FAD-dependent oxidoreductase [Microbacterium sp. ASV49]
MARTATVVGSGPNGLAAAVALARGGYDVQVLEAAPIAGGGVSSAELTLPGFIHDVCSAVHPVAHSSSFMRAFGLDRIEWIRPEISFAHPLDGGRAAVAWRDLERTAEGLGADARAWRAVARPLNRHLEGVADFTGHQLLRMPRHPVTTARFGMRALELGTRLGHTTFRTEEGAALYAGVAAHANTPLPSLGAAGSALLLIAHAHSIGWPYPRGGAQRIADALIADLEAHGGVVETSRRVRSLEELDDDLVLLDTSPRLLLTHPDLPSSYARALRRYRYGPAAAKVDLALDGPVPWTNPDVAAAPTVHVGGTRQAVEASENAVARGRVTANPYVLVVQPSVLDPTRAPAGMQTLWAYIHVPLSSPLDPTELVLRQLERYAPGVRDRVLASHATPASERATLNPAELGGDILGGSFTLAQAVRRPVISRTPWRTPLPGVYLASASTPPGPGVHGLAGWWAARQAMHDAGEHVELGDLFW